MLLVLSFREGEVIPWDLIRRGIEATHPYSVFMVRSMLAVPFFEKALYELAEEQVTPEALTALADSIEGDVEGGLAGRWPLTSSSLCIAQPPSLCTVSHAVTLPTLVV